MAARRNKMQVSTLMASPMSWGDGILLLRVRGRGECKLLSQRSVACLLCEKLHKVTNGIVPPSVEELAANLSVAAERVKGLIATLRGNQACDIWSVFPLRSLAFGGIHDWRHTANRNVLLQITRFG
eukprot:894004-Amphidinium_carterae.1